ncbi:MAG: recombination protein O N-terminal domain-containing protein, partial [Alphaproteobacteria bacterium]|nr:recombination protein O N-terminal domain-containing protein [Alphaproteobacteria bacterium]
MEQWRDQGIVLAARPHGESGAVVSVLTESHGRHNGYVRGGQGSRNRGMLQAGTLV